MTVFTPQICVMMLSGDWLCVWPPKMPPPNGVRTVIGQIKSFAER